MSEQASALTLPRPLPALLALLRRSRLVVLAVFLLALLFALCWSPWQTTTFPAAWNLGLRAPLDGFRSSVIAP